MCGEIILCDVSSCSETSVFLILCDVSNFIFRSRGWIAIFFSSYFWLETWGSGARKWEV